MRHLVLALMIVLLPVRGWMGDAMATQMAGYAATQAAAAIEEAAAEQLAVTATNDSSHHRSASAVMEMSPDCESHHKQASDKEPGNTDNGCANCSVCQACHTVALTVTEPAASEVVRVAAPLSTFAEQFASAEPATGQKPPIS